MPREISGTLLVDSETGVSVDLSDYIDDIDRMDYTSLCLLAPLYYDLLDQMVLWSKKEQVLSSRFERVEPLVFYRELFPVGTFERAGHPEDCKPNGLAMVVGTDKEGHQTARTLLVTDGLEKIEAIQGAPFAFMSPIGYIGKNRSSKNVRWIYALTYDLDGVSDMRHFEDLLYQQHESGFAPAPTFTVNSGRGLHLYYQFEEPVPAYPNILEALKKLKYTLLPLVWNRYTSTEEEAQKQGIVQGFRVIGTQSRLGAGYPVTAYRTGGKHTVEGLLSYVSEADKRKCLEAFKPLRSETPLDEAKDRWPEWYERVILRQGDRQTWHVKRDLYDWWLRLCKSPGSEVAVGHRYFCCMALCIFARKCDVCEEELARDVMSLVPVFDKLSNRPEEAFTEDDALRAMDAYTDSYATFPRKDIEALTGISMPANKRNHRKQKVHLKIARFARDLNYENEGDWRKGNGRPVGSGTKKQLVQDYAADHPESSQRAIAKALGISLTTVNKWLKK